MKKTLVVLAFVLLAGIAKAQTVNFNSFSPLDTPFGSFSTGGLTFTSGGGYMAVWDNSSPNSGGNNGLIYAFGSPIVVTQTGGGAFSLDSIDATISWYDGAGSDTITLVGTGVTSGTDNLILGQGLAPYNSLGFSDVTSVSISQLASGSGYWFISSLTRDTVSAPEGGASLLYLLLAAGACFGAIFFRSRNRFASRAQA